MKHGLHMIFQLDQNAKRSASRLRNSIAYRHGQLNMYSYAFLKAY